MYKRFLLISIFIFLFEVTSVSSVNTRSLQNLDAILTLSGSLQFAATTKDASISVYIPQEGVRSIEVTPSTWQYVQDDLGNKMIQITWDNPSSIENYEIKVRIINSAKYLANADSGLWHLNEAKQVTQMTQTNDEMKEFAYGKETTLDKAIRITEWLERNFAYDYAALKESSFTPRTAEEIWQQQKAVSGEFANLIVALMRSQNIPARVVFSYTLTDLTSDQLDVGHGWAEVYIDGRWVPFDVTFYEAGYLDATHIKFANLLENNVLQILNYENFGSKTAPVWTKNPLKIQVLSYDSNSPKLNLNVKENLQGNEIVLGELDVSWPCALESINFNSCLDQNSKPFIKIFESSRKFWFCDSQKIYYLLQTPNIRSGNIFTCPVILYDEYGNEITKDIRISGNQQSPSDITINGPSQVFIGELFTLQTDISGIFFSPNTTDFIQSNQWTTYQNTPGNYMFYFYANGQKGQKLVQVLSKKDFSIIQVDNPASVPLNSWFLTNATIKNLVNNHIQPIVKLSIGNQTYSQNILFQPLEQKIVTFNASANEVGYQSITVSVEENTITVYSSSILITGKSSPFDFFNPFIDFLKSIWEKITRFFQNLFRH